VTHSWPWIDASPLATASYSLAAVTSTMCKTPSMSWILTRQDQTGMEAVADSLFVRHSLREECSSFLTDLSQ
jgi:hypothetical protein